MNPEQVNQVIETIKTLNLNIDSQSAIKIVEILKPMLWAVIVQQYFSNILFFAFFFSITFFVYKIIKKMMDCDIEKEKQGRI